MKFSLIAIGALFLFACEEENNQPPPPPPPPSKAPAAPAAGETPTGAADGQPAVGQPTVTGQAAEAEPAQPPRANRAPTASEMLGYGDGKGDGRSADLPAFLRNKPKREGKSPLFDGTATRPSGPYAKLRLSPLGVSPIERHWGSKEDLYGQDLGPEDEPVVAPPAEADDGKLFQGEAVVAAGEAPKPNDENDGEVKKYRLVMYKLDKTAGTVETFDRRYASKEARDAASDYASRQGFVQARPSQRQIDAIKKRLGAAKPKPEKKEVCQFKAYWTHNGVRQSRCFQTQEEVDAFSASVRAKDDAARKPTTQKPAAPAGGDQPNSLKPVKIGQ